MVVPLTKNVTVGHKRCAIEDSGLGVFKLHVALWDDPGGCGGYVEELGKGPDLKHAALAQFHGLYPHVKGLVTGLRCLLTVFCKSG